MIIIIICFISQASLIGHMDKLHLLEPSTIFMEFGAGRGTFVYCVIFSWKIQFAGFLMTFVSNEKFWVGVYDQCTVRDNIV